MSEKTGISWTDHTFNPWWGCVKISPGCHHCYAATLANRYGWGWGPNTPRRFFGETHWREPRIWDLRAARDGVRRRVFCASMADVFEDLPVLDTERGRLWNLIRDTPNLDWQLLTKRPENIRTMVPAAWPDRWPPNVWVGTSVEDQSRAEERIPHLAEIPAKVRFLSCEPLLGPLDFANEYRWSGNPASFIGWVIVGGESGLDFRPMDPAWVRCIRNWCLLNRIPFFFKQGSGLMPGTAPFLDGRGWAEFPNGRT